MKIVIMCAICLLTALSAYAQTVIELKSGRTVEGELVETTDEYIKLNVYGVDLTYWMDEIESIELETKPSITTKQETISSALGQRALPNTEDTQEIQKVIKAFLKGIASGDVDSIMKHISLDYYDPVDGRDYTEFPVDGRDYTEFKSGMERSINMYASRYTSRDITDIRILNLKINNNKATAEVNFNHLAFNLSKAELINEIAHREAFLSKENRKWKITRWVHK